MKRFFVTLFALIVVIMAMWTFGPPLFYLVTMETVKIKVTDKTVKAKPGGGDQIYMIFAKREDASEEVFTVRDSTLFFAWNSSDRYGRMEAGGTYTVRVSGIRIPIFSMYRNIYYIRG